MNLHMESTSSGLLLVFLEQLSKKIRRDSTTAVSNAIVLARRRLSKTVKILMADNHGPLQYFVHSCQILVNAQLEMNSY